MTPKKIYLDITDADALARGLHGMHSKVSHVYTAAPRNYATVEYTQLNWRKASLSMPEPMAVILYRTSRGHMELMSVQRETVSDINKWRHLTEACDMEAWIDTDELT